jgi:hypothetical protein
MKGFNRGVSLTSQLTYTIMEIGGCIVRADRPLVPFRLKQLQRRKRFGG